MADSHFLESLAEKLQNSATVRSIYGEPIEVNGKTIIPVAKVSYGLGGGSGSSRPHEDNGQEEEASGQGGGGGVSVAPLGVIEVTGERTRYIPLRSDPLTLFGAFLFGCFFAAWLRRR